MLVQPHVEHRAGGDVCVQESMTTTVEHAYYKLDLKLAQMSVTNTQGEQNSAKRQQEAAYSLRTRV